MNADESLARAFSEELPWLAFLYVSEELTPDEVADFEERLLTDQAAREAVADAMKMADGLWMATALDTFTARETSAAPKAPARSRRGLVRWAMWVGSTIVAAGLAFWVGWWFAQEVASPNRPAIAQPADSEPASPSDADPLERIDGAEQLVGLWSNSRTLLEAWDSNRDPEFSSDEPIDRESQEPEEEAFAWMLAVVSDKSTDAPNATPDVMEN